MLKTYKISTKRRVQAVEITSEVRNAVRESGVKNGICVVYVPHTTAGVVVNESYDPAVMEDLMAKLSQLVPAGMGYRHLEGNADSHIKSSIVGNSASIIVEDGNLLLGRWGGVFFLEFDGPRDRSFHVKIIEG